MALTPFDFILIDAATTTVAGPELGFGRELRNGNTGSAVANQGQFKKYFKIFATYTDVAAGAGGVATIQFQDSPTIGPKAGLSWTTRYTLTLTIPSAAPYMQSRRFLFCTSKRYIRANISALAGSNTPVINVFATVDTQGA